MRVIFRGWGLVGFELIVSGYGLLVSGFELVEVQSRGRTVVSILIFAMSIFQ